MKLASDDEISFCWVTNFPIFEQDEITGKIDFEHNPFSMPSG
jgi:aspartyl-tRNA synthetase